MSGSLQQQTNGFSADLTAIPFAKIFYQLAGQRKTGFVDIYTQAPPEGKVVKRLMILNGLNFYVQGGSLEETLGRILVGQGRLSEDKYQALKQEAGGDYKKLEELAQASLGLNGQEFSELYQFQTELKIKNCFALIKGHIQFRDASTEALQKYLLTPLSPEKIMVAGVAMHYPGVRISKEFPGLDKKHFQVKLELIEKISLFGFGPKEQRWLRGLGREFMVMNATRSSGLKPEQAEQTVLALYFAGCLALPAEEEDFPLGSAYQGAAVKDKNVVEKKPVAETKDTRREVKKEEPTLPIEKMLDKEMSDKELLATIDKLHEKAHQREITFFEIMGVDQATPASHIKRVYFKMARLFHPDARSDLYRGEVREKVESLFTRIGEAYSTLTDAELKRQYVDRLKSKITDSEMEKANRAIQAEMEFQKAVIALRRGSFKEAATALDAAIKLDPEEPEYNIHMAYAQFKVQGAGQAAKSAKVIEENMKQRPKVAEGWFYLGVIYRVTGELEKARGYFEKTLELDQYNQDAQREIRVIDMKLAEARKGKRR